MLSNNGDVNLWCLIDWSGGWYPVHCALHCEVELRRSDLVMLPSLLWWGGWRGRWEGGETGQSWRPSRISWSSWCPRWELNRGEPSDTAEDSCWDAPARQCWPWGICESADPPPPPPPPRPPGRGRACPWCPGWWPRCCSSWRNCSAETRLAGPPAWTGPERGRTDCSPAPGNTGKVARLTAETGSVCLPCHHRCYICTV